MRKFILGFGFALFASAATAEIITVKLFVEGMTCPSCPYIVSGVIKDVEGVSAVKVSLDEQSAIITFDDAVTSLEVLLEATWDYGYPMSPFADAES